MAIAEAMNEINATIEMIVETKDILRIKVILLLLSYPRTRAGMAIISGYRLADAYHLAHQQFPAPLRKVLNREIPALSA